MDHHMMSQMMDTTLTDQDSEYLNGTEITEKMVEKVAVISTVVIMSVGLLGNIVVMLTVLRSPSLYVPMYITLASLALADALTLIFLPSSYMLYLNKGDTAVTCYTLEFLGRVFLLASSLHILLVSYDRYIAVRYPLHARSILTNQRTFIAISAIYVASFILHIYVILTFKYEHGECKITGKRWTYIYDLVMFLLRAVVPVIVLVVLNISVALALTGRLKMRQKMMQHRRASGMARHTKERNRALLMIGTVIVAYTVLTCPAMVYVIIVYILPKVIKRDLIEIDDLTATIWWNVSSVLLNTNAAINPIIYAALSRSFRDLMEKAILCRIPSPERTTTDWAKESSDPGSVASSVSSIQLHGGEQARYSEASRESRSRNDVTDNQSRVSTERISSRPLQRKLSRTEFRYSTRSSGSNRSNGSTVSTPSLILQRKLSRTGARGTQLYTSMENMPGRVRGQSSQESTVKQSSPVQTASLRMTAQRSGTQESASKHSAPAQVVSLRTTAQRSSTHSFHDSSAKNSSPVQTGSLYKTTQCSSEQHLQNTTSKQSSLKQNVSVHVNAKRGAEENGDLHVLPPNLCHD